METKQDAVVMKQDARIRTVVYDVGSWRQGGRGGRLCRIAVDYQN